MQRLGAVGHTQHAAHFEHGALGQVQLGFGDLVGAVACHQAAQLVAAPDMALPCAGNRRCGTARTAGHHHGVGLEPCHESRVDLGGQVHVNGQLLDLFDQVIQQLAVFRVGQRGKKQGSAQTVAALGQRDAVAAQGRHACGFHARRATAHDQYMARVSGRGQRGFKLVACLGIDRAFDALVDENLADTGVAVNAGTNVLRAVALQLDRDLGVGQHLARHRHKIKLTGADALGRRVRLNPANRHHWHAHRFFDGRGIGHKAAGLVYQRCFGEGDAGAQRGVGRHTDGIGTGGLTQLGGGDRIGQRDAAGGAQFFGVEPHPDRELTASAGFHGSNGFQQHAGAVFQRTTIGIVALVVIRRQKASQHVGVGCVQFHPVKAGPLGALGGGGKGVHHQRDVSGAHDPDLWPCLAHAAHKSGKLFSGEGLHDVGFGRRRHRRYPEFAPGGQVPCGGLAGVLKLHGNLGAVAVHPFGQCRQTGNKVILRDTDLERLGRACRESDGAGPHGQQAGAAFGARLVISLDAFAASAVRFGKIGAHGRHHDAVAEFHRTDAGRLEQGGKGIAHGC